MKTIELIEESDESKIIIPVNAVDYESDEYECVLLDKYNNKLIRYIGTYGFAHELVTKVFCNHKRIELKHHYNVDEEHERILQERILLWKLQN